MNTIKLKDSFATNVTFWAYDIFGYLLPGILILFAMWLTNSNFRNILTSFPAIDYVLSLALLASLAYFTGHIVAALSSFLLERSLLKHVIGFPTQWLLSLAEKKDYRLSKLFGRYTSSYSAEFREHFLQTFEDATGFKPKDPQDIFMLSWSYVSVSHPIAYKRATHFLELYGFSRNASMAFFLLSSLPGLPGWNYFFPSLPWIIVCLLSAILMFYNYTKLLRRCDDEVIRGLAIAMKLRPLKYP